MSGRGHAMLMTLELAYSRSEITNSLSVSCHCSYCFGTLGIPDPDETFICPNSQMSTSLNPAYSSDVILVSEIDKFLDDTIMCVP